MGNMDSTELCSLLSKFTQNNDCKTIVGLFLGVFVWEAYLGKTERVKAGSTLGLIWGFVLLVFFAIWGLIRKKESINDGKNGN